MKWLWVEMVAGKGDCGFINSGAGVTVFRKGEKIPVSGRGGRGEFGKLGDMWV